MLKPLLFASLAAVGNALFVFAQRGATPPANPFLFVFGAVLICALYFGAGVWLYRSGDTVAYLLGDWKMVLAGGTGFALTFVGFFLLYSNYGAAQYTLYATLSILTTTIGVGVLIYKEPFNAFHMASVALAIAAIALFAVGNSRA